MSKMLLCGKLMEYDLYDSRNKTIFLPVESSFEPYRFENADFLKFTVRHLIDMCFRANSKTTHVSLYCWAVLYNIGDKVLPEGKMDRQEIIEILQQNSSPIKQDLKEKLLP